MSGSILQMSGHKNQFFLGYYSQPALIISVTILQKKNFYYAVF
jgi:hypothetical protein